MYFYFIYLILVKGVNGAAILKEDKFNNSLPFHNIEYLNVTDIYFATETSISRLPKNVTEANISSVNNSITEANISRVPNSITETNISTVSNSITETNISTESSSIIETVQTETFFPEITTVIPFHNVRLAFIDKLLEKYDRRAWPTYGMNKPTLVFVNIYINSLGSISAANQDFGMDIYLRQSWVDPRLKTSNYGMNETMTLNGQDIIDKIWKPDLFFRNLKSGNFHSMTVPNKLIKLAPDGRILFSMRLTLRLSCHMTFRLYPLDTQRCWVILGSYAQTKDQVIVKWMKDKPITLEKQIEVPEFRTFPQEPMEFERNIDTGVFSFLNVSFVFVRQNGYHLIQTYLPTFLLVMVSWVSFWVPVEAAPARVALGVTTLLSLVTVASGIRSQLPPVSYAKAIDIWIGACSVMVFTSLLEFAGASYLNRMKVYHKEDSCIVFNKPKKELKKGEIEVKIQNSIPPTPDMIKTIQRRRSHTVDRLSRMIFPAVFLIFNMFYWIYYLTQRAKQREKLL